MSKFLIAQHISKPLIPFACKTAEPKLEHTPDDQTSKSDSKRLHQIPNHMQHSTAYVLVFVIRGMGMVMVMRMFSTMRHYCPTILMCFGKSVGMSACVATLPSTVSMSVVSQVAMLISMATSCCTTMVMSMRMAMVMSTRMAVMTMAKGEKKKNVEKDANGGNDEHEASVDGDGVEEALYCLQNKGASEDTNDEDRHNSAHGLCSMIAKRVAGGCALAN
jgi:hypothetical protein